MPGISMGALLRVEAAGMATTNDEKSDERWLPNLCSVFQKHKLTRTFSQLSLYISEEGLSGYTRHCSLCITSCEGFSLWRPAQFDTGLITDIFARLLTCR